MKRFIALCGIGLMLLVVSANSFTEKVSYADSSKIYKPVVDLVFIADAQMPVLAPVNPASFKLNNTSDVVSGETIEVAMNNNSPPNNRYLRCS